MTVRENQTAERIVVVTFERNMAVAEKVAACLNGDIVLYEKGIFEKFIGKYDAIVALFASGIAIREMAPLLSGKWEDPALVVVDSALRFAVPVLGGHHGGNETARKLEALGTIPVVTTATEAHQKQSVEGIAGILGCDVRNRYSTIAVNCALLDGDVEILEVKGPRIVVVSEDVSVLVRRPDGKLTPPDEPENVLAENYTADRTIE